MTSEMMLDHIEWLLNTIATELEYDILFKGSIDTVDIDWRRKYFGVDYTPFVLATHQFEPTQDRDGIQFNYTIYAMPYEKDREKIQEIYDMLFKELNGSFDINDNKISTRPINRDFGLKFIEGSNGLGHYRFEAVFRFSGTSTYFYKLGKDVVLKLDDEIIPINSFKYDHGKVSYVNKISPHEGTNNHNLNTNLLVIETPLNKVNPAISEYLAQGQKVNIDVNIELLAGTYQIINDVYQYTGFTISASTDDVSVSAYLYFAYKSDKLAITINGEEIPILDYAIANKNETLSMQTPQSNLIKNIYLSKARAYSFNIGEEYGSALMARFINDLAGETEILPVYDVTIKLYGLEITKTLILDEIVKESKETANTVLKVSFVESGESNIG